MKDLDVENSINAVFGLCADVSRVSVHGDVFFYLNPKTRDGLKVVKYILRQNGVKAELHWSRYYNAYGPKSLILRVPVYELVHGSTPNFGSLFEERYKNRYGTLGKIVLDKDAVRFFRLFSASKKAMLVNQIIANTK